MDWKAPVTQQLFVSREGRGIVTFMLMTYCSLLVLFHSMLYVCVSLVPAFPFCNDYNLNQKC
jgi:hypothetical protein